MIGFQLSTKLLLLSCMLASIAYAQRDYTPLSIKDAVTARYFSYGAPIALSPDGEWVAYTLGEHGRNKIAWDDNHRYFTSTGNSVYMAHCDVWITNTISGESINLTEGKGASWGPVWSPNGKFLAFYSDHDGRMRLWTWDRASRHIKRVSDVVVRVVGGHEVVRWTPDNGKIICKTLPEGMTLEDATDANLPATKLGNENKPSVILHTSGPQPVWDTANRYLADVTVIDILTGNAQRILRGAKPVGYWVSPNGKYLAVMSLIGPEEGYSYQVLNDLLLVSFADARHRKLASDIRHQFGLSVSWSPDSQMLSFVTNGPRSDGDIYYVNINGGDLQKATSMIHPHFGDSYRAPLWSKKGDAIYAIGANALWQISVINRTANKITELPGKNIVEIVSPGIGGRFWSPDEGKSLVISTRDDTTKQEGFYKVDINTGNYYRLTEGNISRGGFPIFTADASDDGKMFVYTTQDASHCEDIWVMETGSQSPRRLTHVNPQFEKYTFGKTRLIEWQTESGQILHGALLLPANYENGKKYPLVVEVYGGHMMSNYLNKFGLWRDGVNNLQLLATRGYAVLAPDIPLRQGTPMLDMAKAVIPGVNKVIEMGVADINRLGVMGQSFGGYTTLSLLVQTKLFRAAIMRAGYGNLFSLYGAMDKIGSGNKGISILEEGQGRMGGTPWEFRERYIENSPIFFMDRVETPLLIVHGSKDDVVPSFLADEVFIDLRRLRKEVVYAKYEMGRHDFNRLNYLDMVDYCNRVISWFDKHLKPIE
jgi:dipeptidyl aminopeptidase/acylaminoacyl peptidase